MGVPSADSVRQRAEELALISGRTVSTEEDWKQAFAELHGGHPDTDGEVADDEMAEAASERDMVAASLGHHRRSPEGEGSNSLGEELVEEGLDEAEHDRMLSARRNVDLPDESEPE